MFLAMRFLGHFFILALSGKVESGFPSKSATNKEPKAFRIFQEML
jgi:hypothetical protein